MISMVKWMPSDLMVICMLKWMASDLMGISIVTWTSDLMEICMVT